MPKLSPCPFCGAKMDGETMNNKCVNCSEKCPQAELAHNVALGRMYAMKELVPLLKKIESGELTPVAHGRWKFLDIDGWWFDECSICGNTTPNRDGSPPDWNYCPNCGAKMEASPGISS